MQKYNDLSSFVKNGCQKLVNRSFFIQKLIGFHCFGSISISIFTVISHVHCSFIEMKSDQLPQLDNEYSEKSDLPVLCLMEKAIESTFI